MTSHSRQKEYWCTKIQDNFYFLVTVKKGNQKENENIYFDSDLVWRMKLTIIKG